MNPKRIAEMLGELRVLPMFPNDPDVIVALMRLCGSMCSSEAQVRWLVSRMTNGLYSQWPGPGEMRACLCSKFKPADGINACSTVYPDGIPSETGYDPLAIGSGERKRLGPRDEASSDAIANAVFAIAAETLNVRGAEFSKPLTQEEIQVAPSWLRKLEGYDE